MTDMPRSRAFASRTPDFNDALNRADREGYTLCDEAVAHLKRIDRLDAAYWVCRRENRVLRDKVHNLTDEPQQQIAELDRIISLMDRQRVHQQPNASLCPEDSYRLQRRAEIKSGLRRR
jgi:hypothetical protein